MKFWNNHPSFIAQGSGQIAFLENKECIPSFINSTEVSRLFDLQIIPFK